MTLEDIESGAMVFIDANIFIYHFTGASETCTAFLDRCETGDINGVTSLNVLLEVLHRLMMVEAVKKGLIKPPNLVKKLKKNPDKIKQLDEYYVNTKKIIDMEIRALPVSYDTLQNSHYFRTKYGLMVNDSIIASSMREEGIQLLATNDEEFRKVDGVAVVSPGDIDL